MFRRSPEPHPRRFEATLSGARVTILGTIQGLAGESERLQRAWDQSGERGALLALGVPPEDLRNLQRMGREGVDAFMDQELDTGSYEDWILPQLAVFGDIAMPPDELLLAERLAREHEAAIEAIDLDDEAYADLYVKHVSGFQMVRGQLRQKRAVADAGGRAGSAEELMLLWDESLTSIRGYRKFEEERERFMADKLNDLAAREGHHRIIAVVPYARAAGIAEKLGARAKEDAPASSAPA